MSAQEDNNEITLEWALHYAAHGYRVVPIKPKEKRPPMGAWQDVATTQTGTIRAWWEGNYQGYGIGIVTGTLDNGTRYFVLDIDEHDPENSGSATLRRLEQQNQPLPDTVRARTGSGGIHMLYTLADHHADIGNGAGRLLGAGIDVRAINAQIVVAPTIHPNGNAYDWEQDHAIGEIEMAEAPDWLVNLLIPKQYPVNNPNISLTSSKPMINSMNEGMNDQQYPANDLNIPLTSNKPIINSINESINDERAGTKFNRSTTWDDLLMNDGWTPHHVEGMTFYWTRPNKHPRDGVSATVNHNGNDNLTVFTTSIANLPAGSYDRFGYWTQTRHGGDFTDAARTLNAQNEDQIATWIKAIQQDTTPTIATPSTDPLATWYVDWAQLWSTENQQGEWLCEPLLARGRAHALYASAKSGKSLLLLELAAALATGRAVLNLPKRDPIPVLYIDYEMTGADIRDRLEAFGYSKDDNMELLHYVLLPSIGGLDTKAGADTVIAAVTQKNIQLVVIDTTARAVEGEENDADTLRAFYRWSGVALKSLGVTWVRADHAGKDTAKGQRGSSAKNDDVDVVWRFTKRNSTSILIEATHRRMQWIPEKLELELREHNGVLMHSLIGDEISDAAQQLALQLDKIDAPIDITARAARDLLKKNNIKSASDILRSALRVRRLRISSDIIDTWVDNIEKIGTSDGTRAATPTAHDNGTTFGTRDTTASLRGGTRSAHDGTQSSGGVPLVPRPKGRHNDDTPTLYDLNPDNIDDWI